MSDFRPYPVLCSTAHCGRLAAYKIAARWSDGKIAELKTYALSCADCLPTQLQAARDRQPRCLLVPGETMEPVGVYILQPGCRDHQLPRLPDSESV
ncbi:MAG: hypothetical protein LC104_13730 [Bacteroidales bacterium]|nr:hypothetical protein [Bacteroidales bacterium]